MTSYSNGGVFNPAYHDSETLEIDRRSRKYQHANPYARENPPWWGENAEPRDDTEWGAPTDEWTGTENFPMGLISPRQGSSHWQHNL
ncbi:hypothetical protein ATANTOWER_012969, partial [Ataeniobius toweri]|nr:hypothetical protein [Ataeniobius toweri]